MNAFCTGKLRKLVVVLINLISSLTSENDNFNNSLDISQYGKISLVIQISDIEKQMVVLEVERKYQIE